MQNKWERKSRYTNRKQAELSEKYLYKGARICIEGRIQTGSYINREGQKVYTTDVVVERLEFLEKSRTDNNQPAPAPEDAENYADRFMDIPDGIEEELPFN